jgi:hypothetical protein
VNTSCPRTSTGTSYKKAERRKEIRGGRVSVNEKKGDVNDMMCAIPDAAAPCIFDVFPLKQRLHNEKKSSLWSG